MRTIGIKGSKDTGSDTAKSGNGKALTAMNGIKGNRDTGTRTRKAGIGTATTATSIAKEPTAGSGPAATDSTSALTDRICMWASRDRRGSYMLAEEKL